jgi:nucleotide-binding universal stress UspA family protein
MDKNAEPPMFVRGIMRTIIPSRAGKLLQEHQSNLLEERALFFATYAAAGRADDARIIAQNIIKWDRFSNAPEVLRKASETVLGDKTNEFLQTLQLASLINAPNARPTPQTADARKPPATATPPPKTAPPKPKAKHKTDETEVIQMTPFLVTAKTRGIIPIAFFAPGNRLFGKRITAPPTVVDSKHWSYAEKPDEQAFITVLETHAQKHGLSVEDRIISVDGEKTQGMPITRLCEHWFEGDPGRQVTLLVQGAGENESNFRKVNVTTISITRLRKLMEDWRQQQATKE